MRAFTIGASRERAADILRNARGSEASITRTPGDDSGVRKVTHGYTIASNPFWYSDSGSHPLTMRILERDGTSWANDVVITCDVR